MNIPIVYEDESLVVINKPAGVIVNRAVSVGKETIQDWTEKKYQISNIQYQKNDFYSRSGIVHRIDKDTSGLLIIAKVPQAFYDLQSQFKQRSIVKKYTALVHGLVSAEGEIKASIGRLPWNRERFGVIPGGRQAITSYKVISRYKLDSNTFTLLEVMPYTGRTHQIRIHLKYIGNTIVSDYFYGGRKTYREDLKFCPRLFLHAGYMKFKHPVSLALLEIRAGLPDDLKEVLINKLNILD
ncbi:RluA family pseudouridine synthase [Candidatus Gottesmanbacteria bacterium]|nr:RluA family pseudouridine synthase [Candidatus Gottesmanbacteria bacterium]